MDRKVAGIRYVAEEKEARVLAEQGEGKQKFWITGIQRYEMQLETRVQKTIWDRGILEGLGGNQPRYSHSH